MRPTFVTALLLTLAPVGCGDNLTHPVQDHPGIGGANGDGGGGGSAFSCIPNLDGQIDASELAAVFNVPVSYLVNPASEPRQVDVVGTQESDGLTWDFSQDFASDKSFTLVASEASAGWYASSFPKGQFVTSIDVEGTLDGIYSSDDAGLYLQGIASHEEKPSNGQTLLVYDAPISVFRFPLKPGVSFVSTGTIENGVIQGLPYAGKDIYEVTDDAIGELVLHDYTFKQVHRVRTHVTTTPATGESQSHWQVGFLFECFGEVTRATSVEGEMNENFTTAAELRRLGQ